MAIEISSCNVSDKKTTIFNNISKKENPKHLV
jgi:hypothetical protein